MQSRLVLMPAIPHLQPLTPAVMFEVVAAKYIKIDIATFRAFVKDGVIPFRVHPGRSRRIYLKEDLDAYLRNLPIGRPNRCRIGTGDDPSKPPMTKEVSIGR